MSFYELPMHFVKARTLRFVTLLSFLTSKRTVLNNVRLRFGFTLFAACFVLLRILELDLLVLRTAENRVFGCQILILDEHYLPLALFCYGLFS